MTKKHFKALAEVLKDLPTHDDSIAGGGVVKYDVVVERLADFCETQNDRFDRDRFFKAVYGLRLVGLCK